MFLLMHGLSTELWSCWCFNQFRWWIMLWALSCRSSWMNRLLSPPVVSGCGSTNNLQWKYGGDDPRRDPYISVDFNPLLSKSHQITWKLGSMAPTGPLNKYLLSTTYFSQVLKSWFTRKWLFSEKIRWYEKLLEPPEKEPIFILIYEPRAHSALFWKAIIGTRNPDYSEMYLRSRGSAPPL